MVGEEEVLGVQNEDVCEHDGVLRQSPVDPKWTCVFVPFATLGGIKVWPIPAEVQLSHWISKQRQRIPPETVLHLQLDFTMI